MDKTERTSNRIKKTAGKSPSKKCSNSNGKNNNNNGVSSGDGNSLTTFGSSSNSGDDGDLVIEDDNTWECSVCTYRNSQETFKCLMCDVCKGTSTRKPRYNHDLVAQKVKKQQIQIHQKLLKSSKHQQQLQQSSSSSSSSSSQLNDSSLDEQLVNEVKKGQSKVNREIKGGGKGKQSIDEEPGPSVDSGEKHDSQDEITTKSNHHNLSSPNGSSSLSTTANNNSSKSTKSRENNLIKTYQKSSLMKMKNIDRNDFLAQAVTVNNVTVIITEFQPKKKLKTPQTKKTSQ